MALGSRTASFALAGDRRAVSSYLCRGCALRSLHSSCINRADSSSQAESNNAQRGKAGPKLAGSQLATRMLQGLRGQAAGRPQNQQSRGGNRQAQGSKPGSPAGKPQQQGDNKYRSGPIFRKVLFGREASLTPRNNARFGNAGRDRGPGTKKGFSPRKREAENEREDGALENEILTPEEIAERRDILKAKKMDVEDLVEHLASEEQRKKVLQLRQGAVMRFQSAEEKDAIVKLAGALPFKPVDATYRKLVRERQLEGRYSELEGPQGSAPKEKALSQLRTALKLNASCNTAMVEAIEQIVKKRWAAQRSA